MNPRRFYLPLAGGLLAGAVATLSFNSPPDVIPMPEPSPAPVVLPATPTTKPGVVQATRVEILDSTGKVVAVLTSENGVPVAVVSDDGKARQIDLAKVARLMR